MAGKGLGKKARLVPNKFGASQNRRSFFYVREFQENKVELILDKLYDNNFDERLKPALRNYLVVSLVSAMEYFFRSEARRIVDEYDKDITGPFLWRDTHSNIKSRSTDKGEEHNQRKYSCF